MNPKPYCTQKQIIDCKECNLSSYNIDCYNLSIETKWVLMSKVVVKPPSV
jgi:hypothetical protein